MTRPRLLLPATALLALPIPAAAAAMVRVQVHGGSAHNFATTLTIRQDGFPDLRYSARYSTRPLDGAPYLAVRCAWWKGSRGWEVQVLHHKLYLEDPQLPVERFEVTHGYSLVTLQRAGTVGGWEWRVGAGAVVAHPESTIRRMTVVTGYGLTGPSAIAGVGRLWSLGKHVIVSGETQLSAARARVHVAAGTADVPNVALHGLIGVGFSF